ncbi:hypothetical protein J6590_005964 [Homalodisca vitripennis]|nr:hypothetical protein J6590_005964 [Homalodisca vitripennis]
MCLEHISKVISVSFSKKDISLAHRLRLYSRKHAHPPIVVHLGWQRRGTRKGSTPRRSHPPLLTPGNVYINEQLIPHNKALPGQARRLVRAKKIQFAGFFNGKIIIKPTENTDSIRVLHMEDLDRCIKQTALEYHSSNSVYQSAKLCSSHARVPAGDLNTCARVWLERRLECVKSLFMTGRAGCAWVCATGFIGR